MRLFKKYILAIGISAAALCMSACGNSTTVPTATTAAAITSNLATPSDITTEDAEIERLTNMEVPERPSLAKMGTVKLADISAINVSVEKMEEVTDADVMEHIMNLMANHKEETEDAAMDGDYVTIDFEGKIDGKAFENGSASDYILQLGSDSFIDGFEDQLIGHKKGDVVEVKVTFPDDYYEESLAGKDAVFTTTIKKVETVPALTDAFVKENKSEIGVDVETVDALKDYYRKWLTAIYQYQYDYTVQNDAMQSIINDSEIEVSDEMMNYARAYLVHQEIEDMKSYNETLKDVLTNNSLTLQDFKDEINDSAELFAKQRIIIATLADKYGITATKESLETLASEIKLVSGNEDVTLDSLNEKYGEENVKFEAINNEVLKKVQSEVKVSEKDASADVATGSEIAEEADVVAETTAEN